MAGNQPLCISRKHGVSPNGVHVLAHAVRSHINDDFNRITSENETSRLKTSKSQNHSHFQIQEAIKCSVGLTAPPKQQPHLRLNMIVSKIATRRPPRENAIEDSLDKFDLSNIRKTKLPAPSWRANKSQKKSLQSAIFYNRRKIEEMQAAKAKLKCPRYNPNDLVQERKYNDFQCLLSRSQSAQRNEKDKLQDGNFSLLNVGFQRLSQNTPLVVESEDPLQDDVTDGSNILVEQISNENENFRFSPKTKEKFVFNPIITPVAKSVGTATELLKHHYSQLLEETSYADKSYDSPGNRTISSSSSGVTVAEETLRLTYYTGRFKTPLNSLCHPRSFVDNVYDSNPSNNPDFNWFPNSQQLDFFEE